MRRLVLQFRRFKWQGRWFVQVYYSNDKKKEGVFLLSQPFGLGLARHPEHHSCLKYYSFRTRDEALKGLHTYKNTYPLVIVRSGTRELQEEKK